MSSTALFLSCLAAWGTARLVITRGLWRSQLNYRGRPVGLGGGAILATGSTVGWLVGYFLGLPPREVGLFTVGSLTMFVLGAADDRWGDPQVKGFKGHLRRWRQRGGDTALLKAAGAFSLGLAAARLSSGSGWEAIGDALVVALSANAVNLLDLRPGRALKGFSLGFLLLLISGTSMALLLGPLVAAAVAYAPHDFRERLMLGDSGANLLGVALGLAAALSFSGREQLFVLGGLIVLHLFAEKGSISRLIERVSWLGYMDRLGRPKE